MLLPLHSQFRQYAQPNSKHPDADVPSNFVLALGLFVSALWVPAAIEPNGSSTVSCACQGGGYSMDLSLSCH